jgi:hypothetical protein
VLDSVDGMAKADGAHAGCQADQHGQDRQQRLFAAQQVAGALKQVRHRSPWPPTRHYRRAGSKAETSSGAGTWWFPSRPEPESGSAMVRVSIQVCYHPAAILEYRNVGRFLGVRSPSPGGSLVRKLIYGLLGLVALVLVAAAVIGIVMGWALFSPRKGAAANPKLDEELKAGRLGDYVPPRPDPFDRILSFNRRLDLSIKQPLFCKSRHELAGQLAPMFR